MNLTKLFEMQKVLRERINYNEPDRFNKLILALLVELGECANEWRGFKYWSKNQEPRTLKRIDCFKCSGTGFGTPGWLKNCPDCNGSGKEKTNPLLEEYVDCLHFILTIGLELGFMITDLPEISKPRKTITRMFSDLMLGVGTLNFSEADKQQNYVSVFNEFIELGSMLGFDWEEIEQAYFAKNAVNHQRQEDGY